MVWEGLPFSGKFIETSKLVPVFFLFFSSPLQKFQGLTGDEGVKWLFYMNEILGVDPRKFIMDFSHSSQENGTLGLHRLVARLGNVLPYFPKQRNGEKSDKHLFPGSMPQKDHGIGKVDMGPWASEMAWVLCVLKHYRIRC